MKPTVSSLLSSLASFLKGEKRISSSEFEHAVNEVLLSDTVDDALGRKHISEEGSLAISAVWACVRILSETVGTLPIHLYHKTASGREQAKGHPCATILSKPNSYLTRFGLLHHLMMGRALWGNGYARIHRDGQFRPERLQILRPYDVEPILTVDDEPGYDWGLPVGLNLALLKDEVEFECCFHLNKNWFCKFP